MKITIPDLSLVMLIGASGSGKSSFARKHFLPTEIVSSDTCRGLVCDDENSQEATKEAFSLLHQMVEHRLRFGRLTVVDATNVQAPARASLIELARKYHMLPVAITFDLPEALHHERNAQRPDRQFGPHVVRHQLKNLRQSVRSLRREGFRHTFLFKTVDEVDAAIIERQPLYNSRKELTGPFDIIGDVHGCFDELKELLGNLGYFVDEVSQVVTPPEGRTALFLGDLVDRGPDSPGVLRLVMQMVAAGTALCVPGNHDVKLMRHLRGEDVKLNHGLDLTVAQLSKETEEFRGQVGSFIKDLVSHYVLDGGKLVIAHAGMPESMQGRGSARVREFALYGETTGEIDEFGLPVRYKWAEDYRGDALVAYGHTPVPEVDWLNGTVCLDTGCVFGGHLSALRYPEREVVSVPARTTYVEPVRPLVNITAGLSSQHSVDDVLDLDDVRRRMHIKTRAGGTVVIAEENATAALEIMSRFAANPKWLVYLPPTMSPSETSERDDFLEHPAEAFSYFRNQELSQVVIQEKHMGSRAVVVLCRSEEVAQRRFGVMGEGIGIITTRTGRRFFDDSATEQALLHRFSEAMAESGLWDELETDWVVLDAELMPWSAKAQGLIRSQFAPVGISGSAALETLNSALRQATSRMPDEIILADLLNKSEARSHSVEGYRAAYRRYSWEITNLEDYKLAPFHIMATEGCVHIDKNHLWHMETLQRLCAADPKVLRATQYRVVDLNDEASVEAGTDWWLDLTSNGGEGMVIKPIDFNVRTARGFVQPALKCRGPEYLRIIYGPEYLEPENLKRLKKRGLARKRSLANREFVLGVEALERFVNREPLRRVHECVFGVLALESEPVDPRL